MNQIVCNTRALTAPFTGVQRYISALLGALGSQIDRAAPRAPRQGIGGHLWEQSMLPHLCRSRLLWSPSNSGPLAVRRQVVTVHDLVPIEHPEWVSPAFGGWYRFLLPRLLSRVDRIIAVSAFTKRTIVERCGVPAERIDVVHNGVDERFAPQPAERIEAAMRVLGIPSRRYILSACSLEPRKNLKRLLLAWEALRDELGSDVHLVLAGKYGSPRIFPALNLDRIPARVHFAGNVPDDHLPALMSGATAFVYPSLYEGFGLPPLEAMACGTPVLTSNTTAIAEVVGDAGILVDPTDVGNIAERLLQLCRSSELRDALRARGLERAAQLTWARSARKTMAILQDVAHGGP